MHFTYTCTQPSCTIFGPALDHNQQLPSVMECGLGDCSQNQPHSERSSLLQCHWTTWRQIITPPQCHWTFTTALQMVFTELVCCPRASHGGVKQIENLNWFFSDLTAGNTVGQMGQRSHCRRNIEYSSFQTQPSVVLHVDIRLQLKSQTHTQNPPSL